MYLFCTDSSIPDTLVYRDKPGTEKQFKRFNYWTCIVLILFLIANSAVSVFAAEPAKAEIPSVFMTKTEICRIATVGRNT